MLKAFLAFIILSLAVPAYAARKSGGYKSKSPGYGYTNSKSTRVKGSVNRKTGTYSAPHRRTAPNQTTGDNYSTKGNQNPWTGKEGTK